MPRIDTDLSKVRQLPVTHRATIPESYLDQMHHMNVMWYSHLFSNAMGGVFEMIGLDFGRQDQQHSGTFALEGHIHYLAEVRVGHQVAVHSRLIGRSEKRFYVMHFMVNETRDNLAATFENLGTHVDMRSRRSAPLPSQVAEKYDAILALHHQLDWAAPVCGIMNP